MSQCVFDIAYTASLRSTLLKGRGEQIAIGRFHLMPKAGFILQRHLVPLVCKYAGRLQFLGLVAAVLFSMATYPPPLLISILEYLPLARMASTSACRLR